MKISYILLAALCIGLLAGNQVRAESAESPKLVEIPKIIGVFGDSLGDGVWTGLYNILKAHHPDDKLFRHTEVGTGLTNRKFADWIKEFSSQLDNDKINVAVVMFGANDEQGIRDENHKGYVFKSEGWKRTYGAHIDAMFAEFEKRKVTVVWLGLPVMRNAEMNEGAQFLNALFIEKVKSHNGIFVPLADDFKGPDGGFDAHHTDVKGKSHLLRAEDGVHFTIYGYELIAGKAYEAIPAPVTASVATALPVTATPPDSPTPPSPPAPVTASTPTPTPAAAAAVPSAPTTPAPPAR